MNKAFTKETDADEELEQPEVELPSDVKNYMTPNGFAELQDELRSLLNKERPKTVEVLRWAAGNGDRSENADYTYAKKRLREIDRRIRYLTRRIESAEIVNPELQKHLTQVFFGATITYSKGKTKKTVKIVGIDEADLKQGKISWISPVAKAFIKGYVGYVGDVVEVKTPTGKEKLKILEIKY